MRRFFGWFGRHKVTAVFAILLVIGATALAFLYFSQRVQLYKENKAYKDTEIDITQIAHNFQKMGESNMSNFNYCIHKNFGAVFEADTVFCNVEVDTTFNNSNLSQAQDYATKALKILSGRVFSVEKNHFNNDSTDLAAYTFSMNNLRCDFDTNYYSEAPGFVSKNPNVRLEPTTTLITLNCGAKALKDYFPVVQD